MNKYSVTVQLDLANNPQQDSWFALMEPRKVSLAQPLPTMWGGTELSLSQVTHTIS